MENVLVGLKNIMDMNKVDIVAEAIETKYHHKK